MNSKEDIIHTWDLNNRVTLFLLENIEKEWLSAKINGQGRSIGEQFIHINNIRSFWINKVGKKVELKLDKKLSNEAKDLVKALNKSSKKMSEALSKIFDQKSIAGYKPHPTAFFAQMIAHESHHRGQIMSIVTRNGFNINKSVNFGLWNWNK
ncbi:MAG: DinB family protein [Cytophagales bacterium]|nr:DinB family protein [Cytophagales bacterium]